MKSIRLFLLAFFAFIGLTSFVYTPGIVPGKANTNNPASQEIFRYIRCHRQAKNIVVTWGMTSENNVDHYVIYHSEDNDFYYPLGDPIPAGDMKYSIKQESVFPGYHYYYIQAVMSAGSPVNSAVDVVRVVSHG